MKKLLLSSIYITWITGLYTYWIATTSYLPFILWITSLILIGLYCTPALSLKKPQHTFHTKTLPWHLILLISIIILAIILRFYALNSIPILTHDEAKDAGLFPQMVLRGNLRDFFGFNAGINNFFYVFAAIPHLIFSDPMLKVRFFSAFFGVLNVVLIYFVGEELESKKTGLVAAFFMAVYHVHIHFSRTELLNLFDSFYATVIFLSYVFLIRRKKTVHSVIFGLVLGFGLHFYSGLRALILVSLLCMILHLFQTYSLKRAAQEITLFIFTFFVAIGPIVIVMLTRTEEFAAKGTAQTLASSQVVTDLGIHYLQSLGAFIITPINFHYNYGGPFLIFPISVFFVLGLLFFLRKAFRIQDIFVLSSLVVIPFFNSALLTDTNFTHRLMSLVPFITIVTATGLTMVYHALSLFSKKFAAAILLLLCFAIGVYNINLYFAKHIWTNALFINEFRAWSAAKQITKFPKKSTLIYFCGDALMPSYTSVPPLPYLTEGYIIIDSCNPLPTTATNYLYFVVSESMSQPDEYQNLPNTFLSRRIYSSSFNSQYQNNEHLYDLYTISPQ